MSAPVWTQIDAGVALALGVIVETAAIRKLQRPRVFALTLERLEPGLGGRRRLAIRLALAFATLEAVVAAGVVAFRGTAGFVFACALLVACTIFLLAVGRAVQRSVPCACFGRLGRTAAGGREVGRALVLVSGAVLLVVHRAVAGAKGYGAGAIAIAAVVATAVLIIVGQRIGARVRPGVDGGDRSDPDDRALARSLRSLAGYDNDLYTAER